MKYILLLIILLSLFQINWEKQTIGTQSPGLVEVIERHTFSIGWRW